MRRLVIATGIAGLTLFALVVVYSGMTDVAEAITDAGWGVLFVVTARALALVLDGVGWRLLFPRGSALPLGAAIHLRFVREAVNQLLPVAAVGGDVVGARLATFWRRDGATAAASVVADVAVQATTQLVFALCGLAILAYLQGFGDLVRYAAAGLLLAAVGIAAFLYLQGQGGSRLVTGLLRRLAAGREWAAIAVVERVWERLAEIYGVRRGLVLSSLLHLAVWFFGAVEVYVALHFMGHPVSFAEAIVIESLGQAVRGAAFAIPGGLGVQEGGYVALCALFGMPASAGVALSLVKRVADVALGIPYLLVWQVLEGRHALGRDVGGPVPEPCR